MPLQRYLQRLVWACLAPMLVLALALAIGRLQDRYVSERESAERVAASLQANLEHLVQVRLDALRVLGAMGAAPTPEPLQAQYLHARAFFETFGSHVLLADLDRRMLFNTRAPLGTALPDVPWAVGRSAWDAVLATGEPAVGDLLQGPVGQTMLVPLAVPVVRQGRVTAVLANVVDAAEMQRFVDAWQLPAHMSLTLRDGTGRPIARRTTTATSGVGAADASEALSGRAIAQTPWSLEVHFGFASLHEPLLAEALQFGLGLLLALAAAAYAARLGSRRLTEQVASLADEPIDPDDPGAPRNLAPKNSIFEIELARQRLRSLASQRAATQAALHESGRRLRQLLSDFREPVWISENHQIVFANPAAQRLVGTDEATMQGRSVMEFIDAASVPRVRHLLEQVRTGQLEVLVEDVTFPLASPNPKSLLVSGSQLALPDGQANLTIARDVSELQRTRGALERSNLELATLVTRLNTVEEEERIRIARELHDDLQQQLGVITLEQERAAAELPRDALASGAALQRARAVTGAALSSVRRIVRSLRPQALDELGLADALEALVRDMGSGHGLQTECELLGPEGADAALPDEVASGLYRIAQEALTNVHKHARASFVHLLLDLSQPGQATLVVSDDGVGLEATRAAGPETFGIRGMRERVRALGGRLELGAAPGGGTRLQATAAWRVQPPSR